MAPAWPAQRQMAPSTPTEYFAQALLEACSGSLLTLDEFHDLVAASSARVGVEIRPTSVQKLFEVGARRQASGCLDVRALLTTPSVWQEVRAFLDHCVIVVPGGHFEEQAFARARLAQARASGAVGLPTEVLAHSGCLRAPGASPQG